MFPGETLVDLCIINNLKDFHLLDGGIFSFPHTGLYKGYGLKHLNAERSINASGKQMDLFRLDCENIHFSTPHDKDQ